MTGDAPFRLFPEYRLNENYPWQAWLIGWITVLRSILWLVMNPDMTNMLIGSKYMILTVPLLILGIGIWNLRNWAIWSILIFAILDFIFYLCFQEGISLFSMKTFYGEKSFSDIFWTGVFFAALIDGPVGDLVIVSIFPALKKHMGQSINYI